MSGVDLVLAAFRPWAPPLVRRHRRLLQLHHALRAADEGRRSSLATVLFFGSLIAFCLVDQHAADRPQEGGVREHQTHGATVTSTADGSPSRASCWPSSCSWRSTSAGSLDLRSERLDLTQHQQFTLVARAPSEMLATIEEPITLRLLRRRARCATRTRSSASYAERVHEMLRAYAERLERQGRGRDHRPGAVLARGGPRGRLRPGGGAARGRAAAPAISASPAPTRPTTSTSCRFCRPSARASSSTI